MNVFTKTAIVAASFVPAALLAQAVPAPTYVMKAGASDLYERQSSELVLKSTQDAKVRSFATMMIADHTKSTSDVKAAAMQAKVKVGTPKLEPMQAANIAKLRKATGTARDQMYWEQQKAAHAMALELHQSYATAGTVEPLKAVAAATAPVVQHHIEMLNNGGAM
jgi:putative membrane protein